MATILIIDDDEAVRRSIARLLQRAGYSTLEAVDGSDAIHLYAENAGSIDAATLDLAMPVTDGAATLAMLRAYDPTLPIVVVSAFPEPEGLPGRAPGDKRLVGYVQKPFESIELTSELERVMAGR